VHWQQLFTKVWSMALKSSEAAHVSEERVLETVGCRHFNYVFSQFTERFLPGMRLNMEGTQA